MKEPNKNCEICQKPFYSRAWHAKYCEKCRKEANARKRKEYYQEIKETRSQKIKEKRQSLKENDPVAYAEMLAQETKRRRKRVAKNAEYQRQYNARKRAEIGDEAYREYHRRYEQSVNKKGSKAWCQWAKEHDIEAYEAYLERRREYNKKYSNARKSKNNSND